MTNQKKGIHPKGPRGTQNKNKQTAKCAQENVSDQVVVGLSLYLIGYDSSGTSFSGQITEQSKVTPMPSQIFNGCLCEKYC